MPPISTTALNDLRLYYVFIFYFTYLFFKLAYTTPVLRTQSAFFCMFIESCLPWVPEQGTVGASGDLAPLSHLALGLLGEGQMWSPKSGGWADASLVSTIYLLSKRARGFELCRK